MEINQKGLVWYHHNYVHCTLDLGVYQILCQSKNLIAKGRVPSLLVFTVSDRGGIPGFLATVDEMPPLPPHFSFAQRELVPAPHPCSGR